MTPENHDRVPVAEGYRLWAPQYDHDGNPLIGLEEPIVRQQIGEPQGLNALDIGCGTGRHALWLASRGARVTGVDFTEAMLAEARRKPHAQSVRFMLHDVDEGLPLDDGSFDLAVSGLVLEHIQDLDRFFGESARVLRRGGRAVFSAMHPAMFERGVNAQFHDPETGETTRLASIPHSIDAFLAAAQAAGLAVGEVIERPADEALASRFPRAEKYLGCPMLAVLTMTKP
ncbi:MAG: class I SAM-dependent methyltransferase [Planctomycetota bacterium]